MQQLFYRKAGWDPRKFIYINSAVWHTSALVLRKPHFFSRSFPQKSGCLFYSTDELSAIFARQRPSFPNKLSTIRKHGATCAAKYSPAKMPWLEFWYCFISLKLAYTAIAMASQAAEISKDFFQTHV